MPVADDDEARSPAGLVFHGRHPCSRFEKHRVVLDLGEPSDDCDERGVAGIDAELAAKRAGRGRRFLDVDPERDHAKLLRPADAEAPADLPPLLLAHHHDAVGRPREQPLDRHDHAGI